jgi:hypothetical protein
VERTLLTRRLAPAVLAAALAAALPGALAGCLRETSFPCAQDADCTGSAPGRCEPVGYCSFPDPSCASGHRFGEHSGPYASRCADAAEDRCPATYAALPGAWAHVYRAIDAATGWAAQRAACTAEGGYLVEPDDDAELAAVTELTGAAEVWIGVSDAAAEGTFVTGRGAPAAFLPWDAGEPDDLPGIADCVRAKPAGVYADDACATARRAICECEP